MHFYFEKNSVQKLVLNTRNTLLHSSHNYTESKVNFLIVLIILPHNVLMYTSNLEQSLELTRLCQDILAVNDRIYFVSTIHKNGKSIESRFRNDRIITNLTSNEIAMLYMQRTLQSSLTQEFDDVLGPLDFITIQRETLLEFIFPFSSGVVLVMADLDVVSRYLAKTISFLIRDFECKIKDSLYA